MPFKEAPTFLALEKTVASIHAPSPKPKPEPLKKLARWNSIPSRVDCGQRLRKPLPNQFVLSLTK